MDNITQAANTYPLKKLIFSFLICVSALAANAQIGYNYSQYDLGASVGFNSAKTDFVLPRNTYSFIGHFTYNYTPYVNFIAEIQAGAIKADSLVVLPGTGVNFANDFTTVSFRAQLQAGELFDYSQSQIMNGLKNFYISSGVGVVYTNLKVYELDQLLVENKSSTIYIPLKVGYEFKFFNSYNEPFLKLDAGYQMNYVLSDNFDGITSGKYSDAFTQFVIGLKFAIGGKTSYRKAINY